MKRTTLDLWVGLFVTAGIVALFVLALKVGNASNVSVSDGYRVIAEFDNIGGLKVRAPVKSAGVVVGRVEGIALDTNSFRANVTLRIDKQYPFPRDSSASILTAGLLGEQYVGMDGGGDEENLRDGDRLKLTQSAIVLEKVIGQFLYGKAAETSSGGSGK
jgi:phospholipid/cholesterol/gamma-HCH transport system substrate-binding protein